MTRYLLRRVAAALPLVFGIATLLFFILHAAPGDPISILVGPNTSPEAAAAMRRTFGLDAPVAVQYLRWLGAFLTGDFGHSFSHRAPVATVLASALPNTLLLGACALLVAFVVGVGAGTLQALRKDTLTDRTLSVVSLFFYSMPSFWLATMLVLVFAFLAPTVWGWPFAFPVSGMHSVDYASLSPLARVAERVRYLILPTLSLALVLSGGIARFARASVLEVVDRDFVRAARARGLSERRVVLGHALRNALLPLVSLLGLYLPLLFSGAVFVETVFAWPGMGRTVVNAIDARDYPLVMAGSFLFGALVVFGNLLADALYAVADPRVRLGEASRD